MKGGKYIMEFYTKVAGVSFDGRQRYVRRLRIGESLILERDRYNPYDRNAIKVMNSNGEQIGFISKEIASTMAFNMDLGIRYSVIVSAITGTNPGDTMGVNILVRQL